jgi:uncharacterized protein GlcG (DUF336 family)
MHINRYCISSSLSLGVWLLTYPAFAQGYLCYGLPNQSALQAALQTAVGDSNGGLGNNMWATLVAIDGTVCAVAASGNAWLGSRVISAQKANTANDFNLSNGARLNGSGLALSTANLYSAVQPGGTLYGLQHSNPVDASIAYQGELWTFGSASDPMVGSRIGGVNVFGGGLALYSQGGVRSGGLGVSGDTSCTDHFVAWRVRNLLQLDHLLSVPGVSGDPARPDNIVYDINPAPNGGILDPDAGGTLSSSTNGFGHPQCSPATPLPSALPAVQN